MTKILFQTFLANCSQLNTIKIDCAYTSEKKNSHTLFSFPHIQLYATNYSGIDCKHCKWTAGSDLKKIDSHVY